MTGCGCCIVSVMCGGADIVRLSDAAEVFATHDIGLDQLGPVEGESISALVCATKPTVRSLVEVGISLPAGRADPPSTSGTTQFRTGVCLSDTGRVKQRSSFSIRGRIAGTWAAVVGLLFGFVVGPSAPVVADVDPAGQRCFELSGDPGDAAIVNLTPLLASAGGNGQLISSDVKSNPPVASNTNFQPGSVDPNVAVSPIGADGQVCFQNSVHANVDLVADHLGTIAASAYTPALPDGSPDRRVDTRTNQGGSRIAPSGQLCFAVAGDPGDAAIVNLTPLLASAGGNGQLISSDVKSNPPVASNTNFQPGSVDPNVAVSPIGADGQVCFQNSVHANVDLVADHLGTIAASAYTPALPDGSPDRRVDTRTDQGGSRIAPSGQLCFAVAGDPGDAAIVNLTPLLASAGGNGQLISSDVKSNPPVASNTNFQPGSVDPNVAVSPIGADGQVCFQNSVHANVDLVADHLGTIAASAYTPALPDGSPDRRVDTRYDAENPRPECNGSTYTEYETATARTMFGLASRAYEVDPGETSGRRLDEIGSKTVHFDEQMSCWVLVAALRGSHDGLAAITDTEVIVARNTQTNDLVVSFRGTEANLFDILNDLDASRVSWTLPNGDSVSDAVHRGFATAYLAVRDQLVGVLTREALPQVPDARVYFTGHSLGGALATIASIDLADELTEAGYSAEELVTYTFGAPRSISRTMATHHADFLPVSFAVANPMDPVPQVPTAIGDDHYSHLRNMTLLTTSAVGSQVRVDRGDGRNHRGCINSTPSVVNFLGYHPRTMYNARLSAANYAGAPSVWITIAPKFTATAGRIQLRWDTQVEGPCDEVVLYRTSGTPTNNSTTIRDRFARLDTNNVHSTTVIKGDNYWVAYLNGFSEIVSKREYFPTTPTVSLRRNENTLSPDTIDLVWSVSDPGAKDLVVLFDANPYTVGPDGYYRSPVGRVESDPLVATSPGAKLTWVGSDPNKWWVAYIMEDGDGNKRILSTSRGVRG